MIWATARYPPRRAYLEFDPHLVKRKPYTDMLIIARIRIIFILLELSLKVNSYQPQPRSISRMLTAGPRANIESLVDEILGDSLARSFKASERGWATPL